MLGGGQLTLHDVGGKIWHWSLLPGQFICFEVDRVKISRDTGSSIQD